MARKTANYTVTDDGRDKGKVFVITEMSAAQSENWAMRVLFALLKANVDVPENFKELGMAALAEMGLKALSGLRWEDAEPLFAEMLTCVEMIPDPHKPQVRIPFGDGSQIEEVITRIKLRMEVWNLHTGFLQAALPSLIDKAKASGGKFSVTKVSPK